MSDAQRVLWARSLRAFGDGYVAILLPVHLAELGLDALAVGRSRPRRCLARPC
jgi:hypothetical protein